MVVAVVYLHYVYLLPMYLKGSRLTYFLYTFLLMTACMAVYYFIDEWLPFDFYYTSEELSEPFIFSIIYNYLLLMLTAAFSSLYYFVEEWFKNITTASQLRNEKLQAELNFYRPNRVSKQL